MERKVITTADGSSTIQIADWNEHYHSTHGAVQEARHVFLKMGFDHVMATGNHLQKLGILEIGFGTGLNALLTLIHAKKRCVQLHYEGVEAYPVTPEELAQLNYLERLGALEYKGAFEAMHQTPWEEENQITPQFVLKKRRQNFEELNDQQQHNLIYFDAFGARVQPELWEKSIFQKMFEALKTEGILVTYSAKGSVRRAMQEVGFRVERLPGPPGKREMLRATKN